MRRRLTSEMRRMSGKPIKQADEAFPERGLEKKKIKKKRKKENLTKDKQYTGNS